MNIFVTKISSATTRQDLEVLFREFGTVDSARIIMDRETRKSKCFGFVEMPDDTEAMNAINALNETEFQVLNLLLADKPVKALLAERHSLPEDCSKTGESPRRRESSGKKSEFFRSGRPGLRLKEIRKGSGFNPNL